MLDSPMGGANPFAGWSGQPTEGNVSATPSVFSPAGYSNQAAPPAPGNVAQGWAPPGGQGQPTGWNPGQGSPFQQTGMTPGGQGNPSPGAVAIPPGVGTRPPMPGGMQN